MQIQKFVLGDFQTNSFVLSADENTKDCLIIDTGLESSPLIDYLKQNNPNPIAAIFTHGHADHVMGVNALRENFPDIKVAIHKNDAEMLTRPTLNMSPLAGAMFKADPAEIIIENEGPVEFAGIILDVLFTPGHTQGGICLYSEDDEVVFAGDALFATSIGRTDLPGGNYKQLIESIKTKLLTLPGRTKVFTGHGPDTTIETEKNYNQYLI